MKHALFASTVAAALLSAGVMTSASAAENTQPPAQPQQVQQQAQTQVQAQPGAVAAQAGSVVSPAYEVPGRVNRAGSIYFGQ